jgi:hypothetical protein
MVMRNAFSPQEAVSPSKVILWNEQLFIDLSCISDSRATSLLVCETLAMATIEKYLREIWAHSRRYKVDVRR